MGIVVDTVSEVVDIPEEVVDSPDFGASVDTTFILGMAKHRSSVKILLEHRSRASPNPACRVGYVRGTGEPCG